jgi:hypothetical protein
MTQKRISEGLSFEDLKGLINDNIMIDLHKPKIGSVEDTVVVAFDVTYEDPAKDLSQFIETGALEHLDVEVSASPDVDGTWKVFVEFMRDNDLFEKIAAMVGMTMLLDGLTEHSTSKNQLISMPTTFGAMLLIVDMSIAKNIYVINLQKMMWQIV